MRKIAIVGAGQAGLQLTLALLARGYAVTLATNRTAQQIRTGKIMSSQCMFDASLQIERDLDLNWWESTCPTIDGIGFSVPHPEKFGDKVIDWSSRLTRPAQSVDQRLKMSAWLEAAEQRGADIRICDVGIPEMEQLAHEHDVVLLAAGKGEVVKLFGRNAEHSPFDKPQRTLALTYVTGMTPSTPYTRVRFNLIPGVGEYFVFPALTTSGPCEIMVFEGIPGGPMDCWADVTSPEQHLETSLALLRRYLPWEAERCTNIALTDPNGVLAGRFAPTVRNPCLTLPSGKTVLGLGDAVVVNDPITGQGANSAAKCAKIYFDAIVARGNDTFDRQWMQQTFDRYWSYAQSVVEWTNSLLTPPQPHILGLLHVATKAPALASRIANGFDNPQSFSPWWFDERACADMIKEFA
jgi:2-polyprenyl-6-methoxyphenol hydroxylase-like FAD-dependent oxidoreductase